METLPVVAVEHLRIAFGSRVAVQDLSFSIYAGKALAIVGERGSGKSVAGLALMGLLPESARWEGFIHLNAAHITASTDQKVWQDLRGRIVSMVFPESKSALNPLISVGQQLAEAIQINAGQSWQQSKETAIEWLSKVGMPDPRKSYHKYPHQLSDGQKQRVMIAIALSVGPALLIADEPASSLDATAQAGIFELIRSLQQETGMALMFITRDLALATRFADDVSLLRNGAVLEHGPAPQVLNQPQHPYTRALLACRPGTVDKGHRLPVVADFMETDGVPPSPQPLPASSQSTEVLLKVRHLRIWFPLEHDWLGTPLRFLRAVEDVSFDLHRGEVLGLVGKSGSGKSTLTRAIMGLQSVESGQMYFEDKVLARMSGSEWRGMRREVQMLFRDPISALDPRRSVGEAIIEPMLVQGIVRQQEALKEAQRLMSLVHLPADVLTRYPHQLDEEHCQRITIARAISLRPKLIICDECLDAMDISVQAQLLNLLKELQAALKLSILFSSNDLNMIHYMADRVIVMQSGKIVERGSADEVIKHPKEPYTKKLVAAML